MRILIGLAIAATLSSAFVLYSVNHETRELAEAVRNREKAIEKSLRDIAILKAERAHLARPARIAREARALGLEPARQDQFVAHDVADPLARPEGATR